MKLINSTKNLTSDYDIFQKYTSAIKKVIEDCAVCAIEECLFVVERDGLDKEIVWAWPLVDWCLDLDTNAREMTASEIAEFLALGGKIKD